MSASSSYESEIKESSKQNSFLPSASGILKDFWSWKIFDVILLLIKMHISLKAILFCKGSDLPNGCCQQIDNSLVWDRNYRLSINFNNPVSNTDPASFRYPSTQKATYLELKQMVVLCLIRHFENSPLRSAR